MQEKGAPEQNHVNISCDVLYVHSRFSIHGHQGNIPHLEVSNSNKFSQSFTSHRAKYESSIRGVPTPCHQWTCKGHSTPQSSSHVDSIYISWRHYFRCMNLVEPNIRTFIAYASFYTIYLTHFGLLTPYCVSIGSGNGLFPERRIIYLDNCLGGIVRTHSNHSLQYCA